MASNIHFSRQFKLMENFILQLQDKICSELEKSDGKKFIEDKWKIKEGGGGVTRVIAGGNVFEKGGVNFSSVFGKMDKSLAVQMKTKVQNFSACGLSIILHPYSPKIPTIHMNIRYFEMENGKSWFGGGIDLTPYFPFIDDFKYFHKILREACDSVIPNSYIKFKKDCDDYFTIKHRNEMRGIGGVFFDYLKGNEIHFELVKSIGNNFLRSYLPIFERRKNLSFTKKDKKFQLVRRGRYVEFNLIYDRGTLFGLKTGGRIESILISLPSEVNFIYNFTPPKNSKYSEMIKYYQPFNWI